MIAAPPSPSPRRVRKIRVANVNINFPTALPESMAERRSSEGRCADCSLPPSQPWQGALAIHPVGLFVWIVLSPAYEHPRTRRMRPAARALGAARVAAAPPIIFMKSRRRIAVSARRQRCSAFNFSKQKIASSETAVNAQCDGPQAVIATQKLSSDGPSPFTSKSAYNFFWGVLRTDRVARRPRGAAVAPGAGEQRGIEIKNVSHSANRSESE